MLVERLLFFGYEGLGVERAGMCVRDRTADRTSSRYRTNEDNTKEKGPTSRVEPFTARLILVPEIGIEPTTYALRMRRSTN